MTPQERAARLDFLRSEIERVNAEIDALEEYLVSVVDSQLDILEEGKKERYT